MMFTQWFGMALITLIALTSYLSQMNKSLELPLMRWHMQILAVLVAVMYLSLILTVACLFIRHYKLRKYGDLHHKSWNNLMDRLSSLRRLVVSMVGHGL